MVVAVAYPKTGMYLLPPPKILEASKSANSNSKEQTNQNNRPTNQPTKQPCFFVSVSTGTPTRPWPWPRTSAFLVCQAEVIPERLDVTDRSLASFGGTEVQGIEFAGDGGWVGMTGSFSPETIPHE